MATERISVPGIGRGFLYLEEEEYIVTESISVPVQANDIVPSDCGSWESLYTLAPTARGLARCQALLPLRVEDAVRLWKVHLSVRIRFLNMVSCKASQPGPHTSSSIL
jgi:hypothetical protein